LLLSQVSVVDELLQIAIKAEGRRSQLFSPEGIEAAPSCSSIVENWIRTRSMREPPTEVHDRAHQRELRGEEPVGLLGRA
jgi:hypothetical protein